MKRRAKTLAAGAIAAGLAISLPGCTVEEAPESIYGPPSAFSADTSPDASSGSSSSSAQSPEAEPDEFDPAENVPEDIYGPPPLDYEEDDEDEFDPDSNVPTVLYGPPEMLEGDSADSDE